MSQRSYPGGWNQITRTLFLTLRVLIATWKIQAEDRGGISVGPADQTGSRLVSLFIVQEILVVILHAH